MRNTTVKAMLLTFGVVSILTFLLNATLSPVCFYVLFPGVVLDLMITGGHGNTIFIMRVGLAVSVLVNTLVYGAVLTASLVIRRRLRRREGRMPPSR
jgi:hypothetical protein